MSFVKLMKSCLNYSASSKPVLMRRLGNIIKRRNISEASLTKEEIKDFDLTDTENAKIC